MPRVKVPAFLSRSNGSHRKGAKHRTALLATVALLAGMIPAALVFNSTSAGADGGAPTIQSDFADYNPGQTVTLTGANWDSAGSPVHIVVNDSDGYTWQHTADVSAADGTIQDVFKLSTSFISHYSVEASQLAANGTTKLQASSSFTDANPSATLDQCANDQYPSPSTDGCSASASDTRSPSSGTRPRATSTRSTTSPRSTGRWRQRTRASVSVGATRGRSRPLRSRPTHR